jgi:hypothetical protein
MGTYVLWQRPEIARRSCAAVWFAATGYAGGTSEEEAARAREVILAGAPDFFPSKPLPAGVKVWRVSPRSGTDPDDLEGIMSLLFAGIASLVEEHDARAVVPAKPPAEQQAGVAESGGVAALPEHVGAAAHAGGEGAQAVAPSAVDGTVV